VSGFVPLCVQRTGKECRDCVECLSKIPNGQTCATCWNVKLCVGLGVTQPERQFCDYEPSIYRRAQVPA
jgi:hypothetical protein